MVKNVKYPVEIDINQFNFKLEDNQNNTYQCDQAMDYIREIIHPGKTARGGIYFSVYKDSKPRRIIYNTGLESRGVQLEVSIPLP